MVFVNISVSYTPTATDQPLNLGQTKTYVILLLIFGNKCVKRTLILFKFYTFGGMMRNKLTQLTIIDVVILTLIFFGMAIVSSTMGFLELLGNQQSAPDALHFDGNTNTSGMISELVSLLVAGVYLYFRRFDFKQLNFKIQRHTLTKIIAYIIIAGLVATLAEFINAWLFPQSTESADGYQAGEHFAHFSPSFMAFALLNGFFEEIFFVGLLFCVPKKHLPYVILFSLVVRFAFHTYQGLSASFIITTLGVVFALLRLRDSELVPFFLAHSFFDVFGLSWPLLLFYE